MVYVDGYVLPVKKKKLSTYKKIASKAGKIWIKHGALRYTECVGDDLKSVEKWSGFPFPKMAKTKPDETVIFAFVEYKSKAHRNKVNANVMKDPVMTDPKNKNKPMPFEMKKMAYGGFKSIVDYKN